MSDPFKHFSDLAHLANDYTRLIEQLREGLRAHDEMMRQIGGAVEGLGSAASAGGVIEGLGGAMRWISEAVTPLGQAHETLASAMAASGILDQLTVLPDLSAQWRGTFDRFDEIAKLVPSVDFPSAGEFLRISMPRLPALDPSILGGGWSEIVAEADERLRARAEEVAADPKATVEDVEALVAEAEAINAAIPDASRAQMNAYLRSILWWLLGVVAADPTKEAVYRAVAALVFVLTTIASPTAPQRPALLLLEPAATSTGPRHDLGGWQIEGLPEVIRRAGPKAEQRTLEFFTERTRNPNTRQAYEHGVTRFFDWCDDRNLELGEITPFAVAAYVKEMEREYAAPTVKQHLAAIRMLFDYLVVGQILPMNPAASVRGPRNVVNKGKTPVLEPDQARLLLDSIDVSEHSGLRDRALLGVMIYTFARVGAIIGMNVGDYYRQGNRCWIRLHEKGGRLHEVPAHHKAKEYLDAYVESAAIREANGTPLWRSMTKERSLGENRMSRVDVFRMIKRRCRQAELGSAPNCHTFRATGITAYLNGGGMIGHAQAIAAHESPQTTKLYDCTASKITIDEVERIGI